MARKPTGKPNGRPPAAIDQEEFEKLCELQCTQIEIAGWFDCTDDTLNAWCKRTYGERFSDVYKKHAGAGKTSLRRTQFHLAEKSAAMAIWLGKQYLNQREPESETESVEKKLENALTAMEEAFGHDSSSGAE